MLRRKPPRKVSASGGGDRPRNESGLLGGESLALVSMLLPVPVVMGTVALGLLTAIVEAAPSTGTPIYEAESRSSDWS